MKTELWRLVATLERNSGLARSPDTSQIHKLIFINPWIELIRVPFPFHKDFITFTFDDLFNSIYILRRL